MGAYPQQPFPFQAREARAFPPMPSERSLLFAFFAFDSKIEEEPLLAVKAMGIPGGLGGRKLNPIIDAVASAGDPTNRSQAAECRLLSQRLLDSLLCHGSHDREARLIGM